MKADEIRRVAYQTPFQPFRVVLLSGESIDIRRSLRTTVAEDRVLFGVNEDPNTGVAQRLRIIRLGDIAKVEATSLAS
jgi:hypothetical protein